MKGAQLRGELNRNNIFLEGNKWYEIRIEFYNIEGPAAISLKWISPGENEFQLIPARYLKPQ
jgi:hypothetical protein